MRIVIIWTALLLGLVLTEQAQSQLHRSISVSFTIDGKPADCTPFGIELRLNGEIIRPKESAQHFDVPDEFKKPSTQWRDDERVDISLSCSDHTFVFPNQHPAFVRAGDWDLGIARPPHFH